MVVVGHECTLWERNAGFAAVRWAPTATAQIGTAQESINKKRHFDIWKIGWTSACVHPLAIIDAFCRNLVIRGSPAKMSWNSTEEAIQHYIQYSEHSLATSAL